MPSKRLIFFDDFRKITLNTKKNTEIIATIIKKYGFTTATRTNDPTISRII